MINYRTLWFIVIVLVLGFSQALAEPAKDNSPRRVITMEEIQKAGGQDLQKVLNYLLPDLFPKNEEAWYRATRGVTFYVDKTRFEPEDLHSIDVKSVKRILIWEKPWEHAPAEFPSLLNSRYVVSIQTI